PLPDMRGREAIGENRAADWIDPREEAVDPTWTFDLFTPPTIYFNRSSRRFSVTPPGDSGAEEEGRAGSVPVRGLAVIEVRREPFRLQVVGWAREEEPIGFFVDLESGGDVVAKPGHRFAGLDLELRELVVRVEQVPAEESMPWRRAVAEAMVWDARTAELVRLTSAERHWTDEPVARLVSEDGGVAREVRAGDVFRWRDGE